MVAAETPSEYNDWQWMRFKDETNIANWNSDRLGNTRIGVALIGLGRMGLVHLRNILREPRANLLYCIDSDHTRLAACSKSMFFREFGIRALHCDQFDVALADENVHAVMIATPTPSHEELTRRALKAGKSVMCEKPLAPNTGSIMPLFELAKANKVFLLTAFNRRYDPDFRHLNRQVKKGSLGSIQMVRITSRDCQKPPLSYVRVSGGLFHDTCIHDIDMTLWLMRQLPECVQVMGKTWKEFYAGDAEQLANLSQEDRELLKDTDDYFMAIITMKFPDGSLAVIDNSRQASYGYDQRCEVYGAKAMLKLDGRRSVETSESNETGCVQSTLNFGFASRYSAAYMNELQDLLTMAELAESDLYDERELIREHLMEPVRATAVVATHTIADACLEASKKGQMIQMNWSEAFQRQFRIEIEQ